MGVISLRNECLTYNFSSLSHAHFAVFFCCCFSSCLFVSCSVHTWARQLFPLSLLTTLVLHVKSNPQRHYSCNKRKLLHSPPQPPSVFQAGDLLVNKSCVWPPTLRSFGSRPPAAVLRGSASPVKSPASFINVRWTINTVVKLLQKIHFPRTRMRRSTISSHLPVHKCIKISWYE